MGRIPTEREILRCIFDTYADSYPGKIGSKGKPDNDPYIAIDIRLIAEKLKCKPELLFGYLYYHLDAKHRYQQSDNVHVHLFTIQVGDKRHGVNYPYLAALLSNHELEHRRQIWALSISILALAFSLVAIIAQIATTK